MAVAIVAEGSEGNPYGHYPSRGIMGKFEPEVAFGDRTAGCEFRNCFAFNLIISQQLVVKL